MNKNIKYSQNFLTSEKVLRIFYIFVHVITPEVITSINKYRS